MNYFKDFDVGIITLEPCVCTYSVLFVCTANLCRSPMSAALFTEMLKNDGVSESWCVESAGTWAKAGRRSPVKMCEVMAYRGLDLSEHSSRPITTELLHRFSLIVTMEPGQKEALIIEFPDIADRIYTLGELSGRNRAVEDPVGGTNEEFERTAVDIEELLSLGRTRITELAINEIREF